MYAEVAAAAAITPLLLVTTCDPAARGGFASLPGHEVPERLGLTSLHPLYPTDCNSCAGVAATAAVLLLYHLLLYCCCSCSAELSSMFRSLVLTLKYLVMRSLPPPISKSSP